MHDPALSDDVPKRIVEIDFETLAVLAGFVGGAQPPGDSPAAAALEAAREILEDPDRTVRRFGVVRLSNRLFGDDARAFAGLDRATTDSLVDFGDVVAVCEAVEAGRVAQSLELAYDVVVADEPDEERF